MFQSQLNFRERPSPDKLFTPDTQNYKLYERLLQQGEITNGEIIYGMRIANSTGRIDDIRKALKPYLITIEASRIKRGLWKYELKG